MTKTVTAKEVKQALSDGGEIALIDVREHGQYGNGHPFFAVPVAYSVFETRLVEVVPRRDCPLVLFDDDNAIADLAAARADALGYTDVAIMSGGAAAWADAGYELFEGVNLPSKTFGEILEIERHTPRKTPEEVAELQRSEANHIIVDGRPFAEYNRFNIPGGICCPNGELALRVREIVPDPETTIIVNCAGRTRSILGAQTLIDHGVPNPVYALENGTQGWFLAGYKNELGATRRYPQGPTATEKRAELSAKSRDRAVKTGVAFLDGNAVQEWLSDDGRTTYVFDVRTAEEFAADGVAGSRHAPGGQLVQATDQWVGVKGARMVLLDDDMIRAPMVANWLYQLGHEVAVLEGGIAAARGLDLPQREGAGVTPVPPVSAAELTEMRDVGRVQLLDLRPSMTYRAGHIDSAIWSIRPKLDDVGLKPDVPVVLVANDPDVAALAAQRLGELGITGVRQLGGDADAWAAAGLVAVASPDTPSDEACIDFLFHTHQRNDGDAEAARQYIAWEIGLVDRLDEQERANFRLAAA